MDETFAGWDFKVGFPILLTWKVKPMGGYQRRGFGKCSIVWSLESPKHICVLKDEEFCNETFKAMLISMLWKFINDRTLFSNSTYFGKCCFVLLWFLYFRSTILPVTFCLSCLSPVPCAFFLAFFELIGKNQTNLYCIFSLFGYLFTSFTSAFSWGYDMHNISSCSLLRVNIVAFRVRSRIPTVYMCHVCCIPTG
jgi:hypothetical protein